MEHSCETQVDAYIQRYHWELIDRDELIRLTQSALHGQTNQGAVRAAILCVYSVALYQACSGQAGLERREQGYTELYHLLDSIARRRYPAVHADATQRALERIYLTHDRCRQPETFLAFVLQKLRDAARTEIRLAQFGNERWNADNDYQRDTEVVEQPSAIPDPADEVIYHDLQQRLDQCVAYYLRAHPGATHQLMALWLKYIAGFDDKTIAQQLGKTAAAVHVLRSRAIHRLRQEASWQVLAGELGLSTTNPA